MTYHFYLIN